MNRTLVDEAVVEHVAREAELNPSYVVFMAMAGILSAAALLANSVPILIGAMIIAPALAPSALIAFGLVGGQPGLALRGLGVAALGFVVAAAFAMLTTWLLNQTNVIPPETNLLDKPLLEERVRPDWWNVGAAFAAGVVGTVALGKKKTDTLVGTVAALALVPAAAAAGIALMSRDPDRAVGGLVLLGVNVGFIAATGIVVLVTIAAAQARGRRREVVEQAVPLSVLALATVALVCGLLARVDGSGAAPDRTSSFVPVQER